MGFPLTPYTHQTLWPQAFPQQPVQSSHSPGNAYAQGFSARLAYPGIYGNTNGQPYGRPFPDPQSYGRYGYYLPNYRRPATSYLSSPELSTDTMDTHRLRQLEYRTEGLLNRMDSMEQRVNSDTSRIDDLRYREDRLRWRFDDMKNRFDDIQYRIDNRR